MVVTEAFNIYLPEIIKQVKNFAYENYFYDPLINIIEADWNGDIFQFSNIENDMAYDHIYFLKKNGLYEEIDKKGYDSYIVIPDVMSVKFRPKNLGNDAIFDMDKRGILLLNNKVFDLIDKDIHSIKFSYNGKIYIHYNSSNPHIPSDMINPVGNNKLQFMIFHDLTQYTELVKPGSGIKSIIDGFKFSLNVDNKMVDLGDGLDLEVKHPYIVFDYSSITEDPWKNPKSKIRGLGSDMSLDGWTQEKINIIKSDGNYYHNRNVLLTRTAIIIYKDKTYKVVNFDPLERTSDNLTLIDKHSVKIEKDPNMDKLILFIKPFVYTPDYYRVDTLYDYVENINSHAFIHMKEHVRWTNELYWKLECDHILTLDTIIKYGYEEHGDILKIIRHFFRNTRVIDCNKALFFGKSETDEYCKIFGKMSGIDGLISEKMMVVIAFNPLQLQPLVFINNKLLLKDYNVFKVDDCDHILVNMEDYNDIKPKDVKVVFVKQWFLNDKIDTSMIVGNRIIIDSEYLSTFRVNYDPRDLNSVWNVQGELPCFIDSGNGLGVMSSYTKDQNKYNIRYINRGFIYNGDSNYPFETPSDNEYWSDIDDCVFSDESNKVSTPVFSLMNTDSKVMNIVFCGDRDIRILDDIKNKVLEMDFDEDDTMFIDKGGKLVSDRFCDFHNGKFGLNGFYNYKDNDISNTQGVVDEPVLHIFRNELRNNMMGINLNIDSRKFSSWREKSFNQRCSETTNPELLKLLQSKVPAKYNEYEDFIDSDMLHKMYVSICLVPILDNKKSETNYTNLFNLYGNDILDEFKTQLDMFAVYFDESNRSIEEFVKAIKDNGLLNDKAYLTPDKVMVTTNIDIPSIESFVRLYMNNPVPKKGV